MDNTIDVETKRIIDGMASLGKRIGKVSKACKVTIGSGESATINIEIDFSNASDTDVRSWLAADRVIAFQRPTRLLTIDEIKGLDGQTFDATTIGTKAKSKIDTIKSVLNAYSGKSKDEIMDDLVKLGMSNEKAELLADAMVSEI
jgi:hypothetical protein